MVVIPLPLLGVAAPEAAFLLADLVLVAVLLLLAVLALALLPEDPEQYNGAHLLEAVRTGGTEEHLLAHIASPPIRQGDFCQLLTVALHLLDEVPELLDVESCPGAVAHSVHLLLSLGGGQGPLGVAIGFGLKDSHRPHLLSVLCGPGFLSLGLPVLGVEFVELVEFLFPREAREAVVNFQ
jgi:hypothetical protein